MSRKALLSLFISCAIIQTLLPCPVFAEGEDDPLWNRPSYEKKIFDIGQRILAANGITERIAFRFERGKSVNAYASRGHGASNTVTVEKDLLALVSSDDELAAVLSHEIAHILCRHHRRLAMKQTAVMLPMAALVVAAAWNDPSAASGDMAAKMGWAGAQRMSQPFETEADLVGLDYLVKAGYNPLAMETFMTKLTGDAPKLTTFMSTHPLGSKRIEKIHQKIVAQYPQFLNPQTASNPVPGSPYQLQTQPNTISPATATPPGEMTASGTTSPGSPPLDNNNDLSRKLSLIAGSDPPDGDTLPQTVSPDKEPRVETAKPEGANESKPPEKSLPDKKTVALSKPAKINYQPPKSAMIPAPTRAVESLALTNGTAQTAPSASVAQILLTLRPEHLQTLSLIKRYGFLSPTELTENMPTLEGESRAQVLNDLRDKALIRVLGAEPDVLYTLTDWAAQELHPKGK